MIIAKFIVKFLLLTKLSSLLIIVLVFYILYFILLIVIYFAAHFFECRKKQKKNSIWSANSLECLIWNIQTRLKWNKFWYKLIFFNCFNYFSAICLHRKFKFFCFSSHLSVQFLILVWIQFFFDFLLFRILFRCLKQNFFCFFVDSINGKQTNKQKNVWQW